MTQPKRKKQRHKQPPTGSTTNASDAVDDIELPPNPSAEEKLDAGVQETFPASDPVSIAQPSETAYEREKRLKRSR
ncbi:MAG TPA: hypothetical protein VIG70_10595 [Burkholderiales bacterium]